MSSHQTSFVPNDADREADSLAQRMMSALGLDPKDANVISEPEPPAPPPKDLGPSRSILKKRNDTGEPEETRRSKASFQPTEKQNLSNPKRVPHQQPYQQESIGSVRRHRTTPMSGTAGTRCRRILLKAICRISTSRRRTRRPCGTSARSMSRR